MYRSAANVSGKIISDHSLKVDKQEVIGRSKIERPICYQSVEKDFQLMRKIKAMYDSNVGSHDSVDLV